MKERETFFSLTLLAAAATLNPMPWQKPLSGRPRVDLLFAMTSETRTDDHHLTRSTLAVRAGVVLRLHVVPSARLGSVSPRQSHQSCLCAVFLCLKTYLWHVLFDSSVGPCCGVLTPGVDLRKLCFE
jgi:hypothetical protein